VQRRGVRERHQTKPRDHTDFPDLGKSPGKGGSLGQGEGKRRGTSSRGPVAEEVETRAVGNDKAQDTRLLSDRLKATQASVDQLRDEKNKTLREVLKSVQEQLRDARSSLRAQQHLSNTAAHEAGAFPSAAPFA
jgi:hypothetical protein